MLYFIDTEFHEDGRTIDLISIAVVADDGREFYACSREAELSRVSPWVRDNVLPKLPPYSDRAWMSRRQIADGIRRFTGVRVHVAESRKSDVIRRLVEDGDRMRLVLHDLAFAAPHVGEHRDQRGWLGPTAWGEYVSRVQKMASGAIRRPPTDLPLPPVVDGHPEFWAYYADYDWVVLCQLYGTMMRLPSEWPRFCRDLKQLSVDLGSPTHPPKPKEEHNALSDARWNVELYKYLRFIEGERLAASAGQT